MMAPPADTQLLASIAGTPLDQPIPADQLARLLSAPPFVAVAGCMNLRDLGAFAPGFVKPRTVFRSGTLDHMAAPSRQLLRSQLRVARVFDFRRPQEARAPPCAVAGLESTSCPSPEAMDAAPTPRFADFVGEESRARAFGRRYDAILRQHTTGYRMVFEALKTAREGEAVLFHCAGGKDRTGVMAALVLDLVGAPARVVADEYALTRIGLEPFRRHMLRMAVEHYASSGGPSDLSVDTPGLREMMASDAAVMMDFVSRLRDEYGGAEGYMKSWLGFSDRDVETIRRNLRPAAAE